MTLHPQLEKDCHLIGQLPHSTVLLHRNSQIPWLILVPNTTVSDLLDLPEALRNAVMSESTLAAKVIRDHFQVQKLNFAAIGNVVPQLHLHIVGRSEHDPCWPKPVWGNITESREYAVAAIEACREAFLQTAQVAQMDFKPETEAPSGNRS